MIAGVPIAIGPAIVGELDISVYVEGDVNISGSGSLNGTVNLQHHNATTFAFNCDGKGCSRSWDPIPIPDTATESVQAQGRIHLKPSVYAALQLDLDGDVLGVRAGPEPYLFGEIYGCAEASGSKSTPGSSTSQEYHALTADVDWGLDLRVEALAGGQQFWQDKPRITGGHLLFKPLAPSNALIPAVAGMTQPTAGQGATYAIKMPPCYPYSDPMDYAVQWTGGAVLNSSFGRIGSPPGVPTVVPSGSITFSPLSTCASSVRGSANCSGDPLSNTSLTLDWPIPGPNTLTVTPVSDKHGRKFDSSLANQMNVIVQ